MATDLTLLVEDRPGALADVGEALGKAGVNMEGGCGTGGDGRGVIHVLGLRMWLLPGLHLEAAGITVHEENDAILGDPIKGADEPGSMGRMALNNRRRRHQRPRDVPGDRQPWRARHPRQTQGFAN